MSKKNSCVFASAVYIELAQLRGPHRQMGPTPQETLSHNNWIVPYLYTILTENTPIVTLFSLEKPFHINPLQILFILVSFHKREKLSQTVLYTAIPIAGSPSKIGPIPQLGPCLPIKPHMQRTF